MEFFVALEGDSAVESSSAETAPPRVESHSHSISPYGVIRAAFQGARSIHHFPAKNIPCAHTIEIVVNSRNARLQASPEYEENCHDADQNRPRQHREGGQHVHHGACHRDGQVKYHNYLHIMH